MKKAVTALLFIVFSLMNVSAVVINEVEMNPTGKDAGNEWVELHNNGNEDIDISGWEIWEGIVGGRIEPKNITKIPNETIILKNGFYVVSWAGAKLNNNDDGDFVILYDSNGTKVNETNLLEDSKNDMLTWQLCDTWKFLEATKGEENDCAEETNAKEDIIQPPPEETTETSSRDEPKLSTEEIVYESTTEEKPVKIELETINLNPKVIKTENNKEEIVKSYAVYGFVAFCVLLSVLIIIKRKNYKNEFR